MTTLIRPAFRERGFRRITISTSWSSAVNRFIKRSTENPPACSDEARRPWAGCLPAPWLRLPARAFALPAPGSAHKPAAAWPDERCTRFGSGKPCMSYVISAVPFRGGTVPRMMRVAADVHRLAASTSSCARGIGSNRIEVTAGNCEGRARSDCDIQDTRIVLRP